MNDPSTLQRKNVLIILLTNKFPPDVRVEGEVKVLIKQGYRVYLLNIHATSWGWNNFQGVQILRIPAPFSFFINYVFHNILLFFIIPVSSIILDFKVIHVHDLLHSIPVTLIGRMFGCKVIIDLHEDYIGSCMVEIHKSTRIMKRKALEKWIRIIKPLQKITLHLCSRIITISHAETKRIVGLGIPRDKITRIRNLMTIEKIKNINLKEINTDVDLDNKFIISYVGGFGIHRGLDTLVRSIPLILENIEKIHLFLVGDGSTRRSLEHMVTQLNIEEYVTFTGWVEFEVAMSYIALSDLFVIPYIRSPQTDKALPHKIFQAMFLGKCLVVSDVPVMKKIVEGSQIGQVFKAESEEDLADKITHLTSRPELIELYGNNGAKMINTEYNWDNESKKIVELYDSLSS